MYVYIFRLRHFLFLGLLLFSFSVHSQSPPNFVVIMIDDLGYGDLGIYGNAIHQTPNIQKLAEKGMVFSDFHSNGPVCSPTRAAFLTGQYQQRSGIESAIGFNKEEGMPLSKKTLAEYLAQAGYSNGVFGKWHVGHVSLFGPNDQGFNRSVVSNNSPDYHTHMSRVGELDWYKNHKLNEEPGYLTDLVTNHALNFIEEQKKGPFFLFLSHVAIHFPFQGPEDPAHRTEGKIWHDAKYGPLPASQYRRAYKDMLEAVDESVGQVVEKLEELELSDQTVIFITSDNGGYSWVGSNYPLRGQKGDVFEGGHRIPAIAYWPGKIKGQQVETTTLTTMDLTPTFLSLAGIRLGRNNFDGIDFSPVLFNSGTIANRTIFWRFNNAYTGKKHHAVRSGDWKYIFEDGETYLFNLSMDITESNNLIKTYPIIAQNLKEQFLNWESEVE